MGSKMVTQKQVVAILSLGATVVALGFALYNVWMSFQPNTQTTTLRKT